MIGGKILGDLCRCIGHVSYANKNVARHSQIQSLLHYICIGFLAHEEYFGLRD
jgi:hypothetical protein